ncbi:hypothetical protein LCGC14_0643430 [marine sediment metagenome]|uniref:Uncharacterized protein n=1 Tax=marine sediment metagenome TaxID=412755 RepID=A0A0F9RI08_9ZZZZ
MDSIQLLNELAAEAERDGLPVTAEGCREVAREVERLREDNYHGLKLLAINEWPGGGFTISWLPNRQGGYEQGHLSSDGVFWWFPSREVAEAALALAGEEAREAAEAGKDGEG